MIIEKAWDTFGAGCLVILWFLFIPFLLFMPVGIFSNLNINYLIIFIILLEIIYHAEPRSKKEKKKGRGFAVVFLKKISSAVDSFLLIFIGMILFSGIKRLTIQGIIDVFLKVLNWVGIIVFIAALIFIYLWVNRLRDRPNKKIVRNIKTRRTKSKGGKK